MESLKKLYKMTKLYEQNLTKGKKDTVVKLFRKDKTMMSPDEIRGVYEKINELNKGNVQIMIRGRNKARMSTLKGFQTDLIDANDEYYGNNEGFDEMYYLELTFRK